MVFQQILEKQDGGRGSAKRGGKEDGGLARGPQEQQLKAFGGRVDWVGFRKLSLALLNYGNSISLEYLGKISAPVFAREQSLSGHTPERKA